MRRSDNVRLGTEISTLQDLRAALKRSAGNHVVLAGDARELLAQLPSNTVQTVITSPPYWGVRDYGVQRQIGMERRLDRYIQNLMSVFDEVRRVIRADGTLWLNIGDVYASGNRTYRAGDLKYAARAMATRPRTPKGLKQKDLIGVPWRVAFALQAAGWYLRSEVIWHKTNAMPESVGDRPWRTHEHLFLLSKTKDYLFRPRFLADGDSSLRRSVWSMGSGRSRLDGHHAVFPERLVLPCIEATTKKGDIVLDPFCGSGTVGRASVRVGRAFVGVELNQGFAKAARASLGRVAAKV